MFAPFKKINQNKANSNPPVISANEKSKSLKDAFLANGGSNKSSEHAKQNFGTIPLQGRRPPMNNSDFFTALVMDPVVPNFSVTNFVGHGLDDLNGEGFSADFYLPGTSLDNRGYYRYTEAMNFLKAANHTAKSMGAHWRMLYNDFNVINGINDFTGNLNYGYLAVEHGPQNLSWHSSLGLRSHFHMDMEIPGKTSIPEKTPG